MFNVVSAGKRRKLTFWRMASACQMCRFILNIHNVYFDNMVSQIYPSELQLYKVNTSDTEVAFLDLHLSISNDNVPTKIYDERDDFVF